MQSTEQSVGIIVGAFAPTSFIIEKEKSMTILNATSEVFIDVTGIFTNM